MRTVKTPITRTIQHSLTLGLVVVGAFVGIGLGTTGDGPVTASAQAQQTVEEAQQQVEESGFSDVELTREEGDRYYFTGTRDFDGKTLEVAVEDSGVIGAYGETVEHRSDLLDKE